ncbi:MAG: hypothetical protein ACXVEI_02645 [Actinomycetota bacterium]
MPVRYVAGQPPSPPAEPPTPSRRWPFWVIGAALAAMLLLVGVLQVWSPTTDNAWRTYTSRSGGFALSYPPDYQVRFGAPTLVPFGHPDSTVAFTPVASGTLEPGTAGPVMGATAFAAQQVPLTYTAEEIASMILSDVGNAGNPHVRDIGSGPISIGGLDGDRLVLRDRSGRSITVLLNAPGDRILVLVAETRSGTPIMKDETVQTFLRSFRLTSGSA